MTTRVGALEERSDLVPRDIDVSGLPSHAFGVRAPIWWASVLFVLIELTVFALLFASTLFLRENFVIWPTRPLPPLLPGTLGMAAALASVVTMALAVKGAHRHALRPTRRWLAVTTALSLVFTGARLWEMASLPWGWDADAHASCVWLTQGIHALDLGVGAGENVVLTAILFHGPVEDKIYPDIDATALTWFFLVAVWVPFYVLFHVAGRL